MSAEATLDLGGAEKTNLKDIAINRRHSQDFAAHPHKMTQNKQQPTLPLYKMSLSGSCCR